jgi:hypothetical protein
MKSKFGVIEGGKGGRPSIFQDLAALRIPSEESEGETAPAKPQRLPRGKAPFTRVFHSWLPLFPPHDRLFLVLVYRSREGRRKVRLTTEIAAEAGIAIRRKWRYARQLEEMGAIRLEREGRHVLTVTVLSADP